MCIGSDDDAASGTPSAFMSFTTVFKFPPSDQSPSVRERNGHGVFTAPAQSPDRSWEVVWRDEHPAGRRYVWDLAQPRRGVAVS